MYEVKRAIILAAGTGKRMRPLTLTTPKPLVEVRGVRMIDTVIDALQKNGIFEIYIVVGYLREKFRCLKEKYPGIVFIDNPYYDECNNVSSLYVARNHLGSCVILDGDQIIYTPAILDRYFDKSCYCCSWTEGETEEWLLEVKDNTVVHCSRDGGSGGWQLYSVSFWSEQDGQRLREHLEREFEINKNFGIYWDDVAMFCYPGEYDLGIRPIERGDVVELDSLEDLALHDDSYEKYLNKKIYDNKKVMGV